MNTLRSTVLWRDGTDADWLVYADRLASAGDPRGEWLLLEQEAEAMAPGDREALRDLVEEELRVWIDDHCACEQEEELLGWALDLRHRMRPFLPCAPDPLRAALARRPSRLVASARCKGGSSSGVLEDHRSAVIGSLVEWLETAFAGVPRPDASHRTLRQASAADDYAMCDQSGDPVGPWTSLEEGYLLENQWALAHLDEQGIAFYLPAVMRLHLRHPDGHPDDHWLTESLSYTLCPSRGNLVDYQRSRLRLLTAPQRQVIGAFCAVTENTEAMDAWAQALEAGDDDWFDRFQD